MKKELQIIQHFLREMHLLRGVEYFRYLISVLRHLRGNCAFIRNHPEFKVPPQHLAYDAYAAPNWEYYYHSGFKMAQDIVDLLKKYDYDINVVEILEWGCGPGRIIRHLPRLLGPKAHVHGSDYNSESVEWGQDSVDRVQFYTNGLKPPLPVKDNIFDFVYAISVFTHLSEESCLEWIQEIERYLKEEGMLFFTTNSDKVAEFLLPKERTLYDANGFCVRGKFQEGKKMFVAFHAPKYVEHTLLRNFDILEHITPGGFEYIHIQDAWLARKKKHDKL